jgi:ATP-binding cassette, subfamily B, bacterial
LPDEEPLGGPGSGRWKVLGRSLRHHHGNVWVGISAGISWQVLSLAMPLLVGAVIDQGIVAGDATAGVLWALGLMAAAVGSGLCAGLRNRVALVNHARAEARLRDELVSCALRLGRRFHDRISVGDLMSRVASDSKAVTQPADYVGHATGCLFSVAATAVILLHIDRGLAIITLSPLPVVAALIWWSSGDYERVVRTRQRARAETSTAIEEAVSGARVLQGVGAGDVMIDRFRQLNDRLVALGSAVGTREATLRAILQTLPLAQVTIVLLVGGERLAAGHLSAGRLVAFVLYVSALASPLASLGETARMVREALASATRIVDVTAETLADVAGVHPDQAIDAAPRIEVSGLCFEFPGRPPLFKDLTFTMPAGGVVGLVGPTGAGKSTLINLLLRFYSPEAGSITVDGIAIESWDPARLRGAIGVVFQEPLLLQESVWSNLTLFRPDASHSEVLEAARAAKIHTTIEALPYGYATVLGETGQSMSGGQRQRLALTRAILAQPKILLLDEPTAAVDAQREAELASTIREMLKQRTTLLISRRPVMLQLADDVIVLEDGGIVDRGTHTDLLRRSLRYRQLVNADDQSN